MTLHQVVWVFLAAVNAFNALSLAKAVIAYAVELDWIDDGWGQPEYARTLVIAGAVFAVFLGGMAVICVRRAFQ